MIIWFACGKTKAQEAEKISQEDQNFNIHMNIKNMHLWHGSVVTPGVMMASSLEYTTNNKAFTAGLWGGASFNGDYKEFSYYSNYTWFDGFKTSLISHNNYSNSEEPNILSYDKFTSPNFVDVVIEYTISEKIPLSVYWSTILCGLGGDFEKETDNTITDSYSNYLEIKYKILKKAKTQLTIFIGGAFSFTTTKTFYSEHANIVNIGLTLDQEVSLFSTKIPVSATGFWNPETKVGALQLDIQLF